MSRALVVEDSPTQAMELQAMLERAGFEVDVVPDGEQALERSAAATFDVVLSDIVMPGLSGYDVCRRIKANTATSDTPVVLLTTLNDPMDIIQGLECGADNFITKPYEESYLLARIQNLLATKRLRTQGNVSLGVGVEIVFLGRRFTITSEKEQILTLLVTTYEDIVRANQQLQASQASLKEAERRLKEHSEQLAHINKELEAFVYTASHDLKEPLRGIEAFSGFLLEDHAAALDDKGRRYLDMVHDSAIRMRQLIDDLLAFSRIGRQQMPPSRVDLAAILVEVLTVLRFSVQDASAEIIVQPGLPAMNGQRLLLEQLFTNLLSNALKYRRPDVPPHVVVGWRDVAGGVEITVADNGIGVPAEHRERVFGLFERLHGREKYPGTGVGLALCKRIVEQHGGSIRLEETSGGGCTVRLTLAGVDVPDTRRHPRRSPTLEV